MSESKISCPHCAQHIALDDTWAGQTINCPVCQQPFVIPGTPPTAQVITPTPMAPGLRIDRAAASPAPPPPVSSGRPGATSPANASATKTSVLAIVSLVLSILGCGVFAIAGVICGHIARGQIRRNRNLSGAGFATAGIIIGYVMLALNLGLATKFVLDVRQRVKEVQVRQAGQSQFPQPVGGSTGARSMDVNPGGNPTRPSGVSGVKVQSSVPTPADAVSGTVKGEPFAYTRSSLSATVGSLEIDGREVTTEGTLVTVFLNPKRGESLANRTWHITPTTALAATPTVFVIRLHAGTSTKDRINSGYQMELATGEISNGVISGTITLKIGGAAPVDIKGNFVARVN